MFGRNIRNLSLAIASFWCTLFVLSLWPVTRQLVGDCTLEAINSQWLQQDDECILRIIRNKFLFEPRRRHPPEIGHPSRGKAEEIVNMFKDQDSGVFVEYGALDDSKTEFLDQKKRWRGLLIETDPHNFAKLRRTRPNPWIVPTCLSTISRPKIVKLKRYNQIAVSQKVIKSHYVQCFPLFSILMAWNQTNIDYFSLNIKRNEQSILKTVPWNSVNIRVISVNYDEDKEDLESYMTQHGFASVEGTDSAILLFVKN